MKKLKILALLMAFVMVTNVHAALQSRPGVDAKRNTTASDFFKLIREMEAANGALGLNATFEENSSGAYVETSEMNNIDTHMCKNTEWGAVAMLASSNYGAGAANVKSNYNSSSKTYGLTASTTGNRTGIFGMYSGSASDEYMAAGVTSAMKTNSGQVKYLRVADTRYVDSYVSGTKSDFSRYIAGDATYETKTFTNDNDAFVTSSSYIFCRGRYSMFSSLWNLNASNTIVGYASSSTGSRACVWVGEGI